MVVAYDKTKSLELLRQGAQSSSAAFREGQEAAIQSVVENRGRLLVVQKTGWGKSFVYFIATKLLRDAGLGPALLISPLLALMRNQLAAAAKMGVQAATINSDNMDDWPKIERNIQKGIVDILLISPERLANDRFNSEVLSAISSKISMLVVDEAHCISDWGHDFRPHYRLLERIIKKLPKNLRLLATTATANNRVLSDLSAVLGPGLSIERGTLARPSLRLQTIRLPDDVERLAWLAERLPKLTGSGIIYTLTIASAKQVAAWLKSQGLTVEVYSSQSENREVLEELLLENKVKALVATTALGMGYDKPDLAFVIHYQKPGSVVAYYQQVGRAGRGLPAAYGVLLYGEEESINDFFIESAFPSREEVESVLNTLERSPSALSTAEILAQLNISESRLNKAVQLLALESPAPIVKQGSSWQLTTAPLSSSFWTRAERLTALRRAEQTQMQQYAALASGHMEFLIQALDGKVEEIETPLLPALPVAVSPILVRKASQFLQQGDVPILPRKKWPFGGMPLYGLKSLSRISGQAEEGRALCLWGAAGWSRLVRKGMYEDRHLDDKLVAACIAMIKRWGPAPPPTWLTCMPSTRNATVVTDFARRLASALGLPFFAVLTKTERRPEQKTMSNGVQQARNVDGSMAILPGATIPAESVFLFDDLVHSRWTLTVAAWLLQGNGSGPVYPIALAFAPTGTDS